jgi:hypothetical protein
VTGLIVTKEIEGVSPYLAATKAAQNNQQKQLLASDRLETARVFAGHLSPSRQRLGA